MNKKPFIIAHRGASEYESGNSLEAILLAVKQGADMVEMDIRVTKDQILVLNHDDRIKRLNGKLKISTHTYKELEEKGYNFPKLRDVIAKIPESVKLNLDLKNNIMDLALKDLLQETSAEQRVYFDSPNSFLLQRYHLFFPKAKTVFNSALLYDPLNLANTFLVRSLLLIIPTLFSYPLRFLFKHRSIKSYPHFVSMLPRLCKRQDVDFYHSLNIGVFVGTVNKDQNMKKFIDMGVDGIKTDKPDLLYSVIHS